MTIVVGDLHGKLDLAKDVLFNFQDDRIVFVGDYLDSFEYPDNHHIDLLELLLDANDDSSLDVVTLMGNHELSYLIPSMRCSGYRQTIQDYIDAKPWMVREMVTKLKTYTYENGWLITHAGVSADWLPVNPKLLPTCLDVPPCSHELYQIGRGRGGPFAVGGPFWCDYRKEFKPIPGVKQIFGHTRAAGKYGITTVDQENYCVDCLDYHSEFLRIKDDGTLEVLSWD